MTDLQKTHERFITLNSLAADTLREFLAGISSENARLLAENARLRDILDDKGSAVEKLAAYSHFSWSGWIKYQFSKCVRNEDGSLTIPFDYVERWTRQSNTEYADLPEEEKESDQVEAETILVTLRKLTQE